MILSALLCLVICVGHARVSSSRISESWSTIHVSGNMPLPEGFPFPVPPMFMPPRPPKLFPQFPLMPTVSPGFPFSTSSLFPNGAFPSPCGPEGCPRVRKPSIQVPIIEGNPPATTSIPVTFPGKASGGAATVANANTPNPSGGVKPSTPIIETPKCNYCLRPSCRASVVPQINFDAAKDSDVLSRAVRGANKDENKVLEILTTRSEAQVQQVLEKYASSTGRQLAKDISDENTFKFKEFLQALAIPLPIYYARQLDHALRNGNTEVLVEIMTSLSDCGLQEVSEKYLEFNKSPLAKDIKLNTYFEFQKFMVALAELKRDKVQTVNKDLAKKDAELLIKAGVEKFLRTDKNTFFRVFSTRSIPQLREIFMQYDILRKPHKKSIETDIEKLFILKLKLGMMVMVKNVKDQPTFFADELEKALKNEDEYSLIRILRERSGIDLKDIQEAYYKKYKETLASKIRSFKQLSKEYKRALVSFIYQN